MINLKGYVKPKNKVVGITCGAFDLLHAGHILLIKEAKNNCDYLIVCLQTNPNLDRKEKHEPVESMEERRIKLEAVKYVDYVVEYDDEEDLIELIKLIKPDVYTLGNDHKGEKATGWDLVEQKFHNRKIHDWSSTNLRQRICEKEKK